MPANELGEKPHRQQLDREIREMMSTLTRRLAHLQKKPTEGASASNIHDHEDDDEHGGFGIITMAGSNEGATMRGDMNTEGGKSNMKDEEEESHPPLTSYLNSNFQGVNNSIMVGGSYSANDPGIHLDVEERYEDDQVRRHVGKGKKKAFSGSSKSERSSS